MSDLRGQNRAVISETNAVEHIEYHTLTYEGKTSFEIAVDSDEADDITPTSAPAFMASYTPSAC